MLFSIQSNTPCSKSVNLSPLFWCLKLSASHLQYIPTGIELANDLLALGDRWACLIKWPLTPSLSSAVALSVFSGVDVLDRVCACICAQIQSGLGKLILKEEMEKEQIRDRHSRSLSAQRYDPKQSNCDGGKEGRRLALPLRLLPRPRG